MKKNWTRRGFLETSLKRSLGMGGALAGMALPQQGLRAQTAGKSSGRHTPGFNPSQRESLHCAMDAIIPAGDGMPAASEAGCLEYLEALAARAPDIRENLAKSLAGIDSLSRQQLGEDFADLPREGRVEILQNLEAVAPEAFGVLRDFVYEAYYLQPEVWKLLGYAFYSTNQGGPEMEPFDDAALAQVRKMGKKYREVS